AVLLVDLNRFKQVNDTYGHAAGDRLLQEVATRMHGTVRATDTVARLGGDEFAVLLPHASEHAAIFVATKILSALQAPVALDDMTVEVGGSVGISLFPEHGEDPASLLNSADAALYLAKSTGCGCAVNTVPANPQ
ncbi:MAG: hypothetical protein JWO59_2609, partial [Chloroflexi bacterium]|nr:hypothetical protein [Chloroflexota bacterium]